MIINTKEATMSYREKFAWLSAGAIALAYTPYFAYVTISPPPDGAPKIGRLAAFAIAAGAHALLQLAGTARLRTTAHGDIAPMDERDRQIAHRARSIAYIVLLAGVCISGVVLPFQSTGWRITNTSLFAIVLAEITNHGAIAFRYRQQS